MYSKIKHISIITLFVLCAFVTGNMLMPTKTDAIKIGGGKISNVVKASQDYEMVKKSLRYYDGEGRDELFEALKQSEGVNANPTYNNILKNIMTRMTTAVAKTDPTINQPAYNYFVNNSQYFNAFCSLGHNISVNTGVFLFFDNHEDRIAAVVAHELVHGQKKHPIKGAEKKMTIEFLQSAAINLSGVNRLASDVVAVHAKNTGVTKPNEWEADNIAFDYMVASGYNVGAPAAVWQRVIENSTGAKKDALSDILNPSTHPASKDRRDNYSKKLTTYSGGSVSVNADTGEVLVNGKIFMKPAAAGNMSGQERSYLIAGNLAAAAKAKAFSNSATAAGNVVKIGNFNIVTAAAGDGSAADLAATLNAIK